MTNTQFLSLMLKRTVLHVILAALLGAFGYAVAVHFTITTGFMSIFVIMVLIIIKELWFDPKPDWRFYVKSVWDCLIWAFMSFSFCAYLLETYL